MNNRKNEFNDDWGMPEISSKIKKLPVANNNANQPQMNVPQINKNFSNQNNEFGKPENPNQEQVKTFLGSMPVNLMSQFRPGTEENKDLTTQLIETASGTPGMKVLGNAINKIPSVIKTLATKLDPKSLVKEVQQGHDVLENVATGMYDFIKNKAKNFNIKIDENILNKAEELLAKTSKVKKMISSARGGDYNAIHDVQSELGKLGRSGIIHDLPSAQREGQEMLDVRDVINEGIKNNFISQGQNDLAHILEGARNKYRDLIQTYYKHPGIGKMVEHDQRLVPRNIIHFFSEESEPMNKIIERHPEIQRALELSKAKDDIIKNIKYAGIGVPVTGGTIAAGKYSYDILKNLLSSPGLNINNP